MRKIVLILVGAAAAWAQTGAFEVVSIKRTAPEFRGYVDDAGCVNGRMHARGPVDFLISWAYQVRRSDQLRGLPSWASADEWSYDVDARGDGLLGGEECRAMAQTLLDDRFGMRIHRESRVVNGYALVSPDGGKALRAASAKSKQVVLNHQTLDWAADGLSMETLAKILAAHPGVGAPVENRSGLAGSYFFNLQFAARDWEDKPSAFTALKELGLKLERAKLTIGIVVVEQIERPTEN